MQMLSIPFPRAAHALNVSGYGQVIWYISGAAYAFLVPYVFSSLLDISNDLYYAGYFAGVAGFLAVYAAATRLDAVALFSRSWRWSLGLGVLAAAFLVVGVLQREDSTPRPDGLYFIFAIGWRGVLYGTVDALILTAFPVAVAYALFNHSLETMVRRAGFAILALALSLTITATYHLGYEQFREKGVSGPETGNAIISVPAILTVNPLGSVVAHASMHVAAVVHAYETDLYLPPQTFVKAEGGAYAAEVQLTDRDSGGSVKLALDGTLIVALPSNPSTGYAWGIEGELPDGLRQEGEKRYVPAGSTEPVAGAGGTEVFTFTAVEKGDVALKLVYTRAWEDGVAERMFSVGVAVR
jgi:inhibitor of cysteine peptidase